MTNNKNFFRASATDFKKIPGSPIAYWVSEHEKALYLSKDLLGNVADCRKGIDTGENALFLRLWHEISISKSCVDGSDFSKKWYPYNKGGEFRRWYGNRDYFINWQNDGCEIKARLNWKTKKPTIRNTGYHFRNGFTWTTVSSGGFSARYSPEGALFDNGGCTLFADKHLMNIGSFVNSKIMSRYLEFLSPTLNFQPGDISNVLYQKKCFYMKGQSDTCVTISKSNWDSYETSWDFTDLLLLGDNYRKDILKETYCELRRSWKKMTMEMLSMEEENNRIFIEAYGLQDELTPTVPLKEITLTCNPWYRYGKKCDNQSSGQFTEDSDLEARLLTDTMKEFLSYAVGCMMGRYSLDKHGLVLANAGDTLKEYLEKVSKKQESLAFVPDEDGIISVLDGEWFEDDVESRFRQFLRVTFGDENFDENLRFIEDSLGKDIRKYFLSDFYKDHVQTYKKRPIYWMVQSPKKGFQCLIYMHRYNRDTVNRILNRYLREYLVKLRSRISQLEHQLTSEGLSAKERTRSTKEMEQIRKTIRECEEYEREVILPLAQKRIEIDLDDGVKVNYLKFGDALATIPGLAAKEEE